MSPKTLSDAEVLKKVKQLVSANKIRWTTHAEKRMAERGIDKGQVKKCLLSGRFNEGPTISIRPGDIQYEFRMFANVDGESINTVASLFPDKNVLVITLFDPNSGN